VQGLNLRKAANLLANSNGDTQRDAQKTDSLGHDLSRVVTAWAKLPPALKAAILAIVGTVISSPEAEL
jgi:hypothetical protein